MLDADAAEDARQFGDHRQLARRAGGEVRVTALGRRRQELSIDVVQQRLAETGAGGDDRRVSGRDRNALLQHGELVGVEHVDRVRERFQVVDDRRAPEAQRLC